MRDKSVTPSIVLSCLTAVCYVAVTYSKGWAGWLLALLALLGIIFFAFFVVTVLDFASARFTVVWREFRRANSITPIAVVMENARALNTEQINLVLHATAIIKMRLIPGTNGPVKMFVGQGDYEIPQDYVKEFFEDSDPKTLSPQHNWNDSKKREYCAAFTDMLIGLGYAAASVGGNQRATWIEPMETVRKHFGV